MCLHLNRPACECCAEHGTNPVGSSSFGRALPQSEIFFFFLYLPHALNPKRAAGSSRAGVGQSSCVALPWDGGFGDGRPALSSVVVRPVPRCPLACRSRGTGGLPLCPEETGSFGGRWGGLTGRGRAAAGLGRCWLSGVPASSVSVIRQPPTSPVSGSDLPPFHCQQQHRGAGGDPRGPPRSPGPEPSGLRHRRAWPGSVGAGRRPSGLCVSLQVAQKRGPRSGGLGASPGAGAGAAPVPCGKGEPPPRARRWLYPGASRGRAEPGWRPFP